MEDPRSNPNPGLGDSANLSRSIFLVRMDQWIPTPHMFNILNLESLLREKHQMLPPQKNTLSMTRPRSLNFLPDIFILVARPVARDWLPRTASALNSVHPAN
jgi:hypothetical protein